jgi:hypothetical protein
MEGEGEGEIKEKGRERKKWALSAVGQDRNKIIR